MLTFLPHGLLGQLIYKQNIVVPLQAKQVGSFQIYIRESGDIISVKIGIKICLLDCQYILNIGNFSWILETCSKPVLLNPNLLQLKIQNCGHILALVKKSSMQINSSRHKLKKTFNSCINPKKAGPFNNENLFSH